MFVTHAGDFPGKKVQGLIPGNRNELIAPAPVARPGTFLQPAATHHRLRDANAMSQRVRKIFYDPVGIRITGKRANIQLVAIIMGVKHPPMGGVGAEFSVVPAGRNIEIGFAPHRRLRRLTEEGTARRSLN